MLDIKLKLQQGHTNERDWMAPSPLKQLMWNATYACNFRCPICYTNAGEIHTDELSTAEAKQVIEDAKASGVRDIIMSGGEPFMRKDMLELLSYMAEFGLTARIASNGSLLTPELLKQLRRDTLTKSFQVSLETLDEDLYVKTHKSPPGAFQKALNALQTMKEVGFHATISVRVTPETLPGIPALIDRASAEGWSTVTLHCPVHTRRAAGALAQDADILTVLEPVLDHFAGLSDKWLAETYIPWAQYHPVMERLAKKVKVIHRGCRAGRDRLTINPNGDVSPCVCMDMEAACIGNVRKDKLSDLFADSPLCEMMRHPSEHGICASCSNVAVCGGGCRAAAFALTGQINGQDKSCPVWQSKHGGSARQVDS